MMSEVRPPPVPDLPQLPRSPSLHAVLTTPADRTGACRFLPHSRGLPRLTGGSASTTSLSGSAQASLALRPARLLARPKADSCPEASTRPVTRPSRSVATMSYRQLHGWILLPSRRQLLRQEWANAQGDCANNRLLTTGWSFRSAPRMNWQVHPKVNMTAVRPAPRIPQQVSLSPRLFLANSAPTSTCSVQSRKKTHRRSA